MVVLEVHRSDDWLPGLAAPHSDIRGPPALGSTFAVRKRRPQSAFFHTQGVPGALEPISPVASPTALRGQPLTRTQMSVAERGVLPSGFSRTPACNGSEALMPASAFSRPGSSASAGTRGTVYPTIIPPPLELRTEPGCAGPRPSTGGRFNGSRTPRPCSSPCTSAGHSFGAGRPSSPPPRPLRVRPRTGRAYQRPPTVTVLAARSTGMPLGLGDRKGVAPPRDAARRSPTKTLPIASQAAWADNHSYGNWSPRGPQALAEDELGLLVSGKNHRSQQQDAVDAMKMLLDLSAF